MTTRRYTVSLVVNGDADLLAVYSSMTESQFRDEFILPMIEPTSLAMEGVDVTKMTPPVDVDGHTVTFIATIAAPDDVWHEGFAALCELPHAMESCMDITQLANSGG